MQVEAQMDDVGMAKHNDVVRRFEASNATVLLAGTGTLNRGVTVNGANHVIILSPEWSPETTLQAEDRCHRPGQTREVHVHYLLSSHTVDEQMWDLVDQKWAAQRAVQDREAQHKTVEAFPEEAALANAQLAVAKAILTNLKLPPNATPEQKAEAEKQTQQLRREITDRPIFGSLPGIAGFRIKKQPRQEVAVQVTALDKTEKPVLPTMPAGQVVQLAFL